MATFKPSDFTEIAELIGILYEQAEQDVIAKIAKNAEKHLSQSQDQWLKTQQAYIKQNRLMIQRILEAYEKEGAKVLNRLPIRMYLAGVMGADEDLLDKGLITEYDVASVTLDDIKGADELKTMGQFGIIHAGAINALASAYLGAINNASLQVLRNADDIFKKIITQATTSALLGTDTRLQATQKAINQFLAHGVGGFKDKAGRVWNLSTYAQMATRTLITNAHNQGKINRYTEFGRDLVIVSQHQRACGLCRPWERKILSLSGKHPDYPALDEAKGAGLFHPNCGHTFTTYIPGLTVTDDYEPTDPKGYEDQQRLRELERRMRKAKEQLATAVSPEAKKKAQERIDSLSAQINQHCKETGIPRKRSNERIMKAQVVKKANDISTGSTGSTKKNAGSAGKTQNSGQSQKDKEKPKTGFSDEDRKNSEAYKRMMARKEELKKRKEEADRQRKEANKIKEYEFDLDKMTADDLPEALRKMIEERTIGPYSGYKFTGGTQTSTPTIGYATVDKLFGDIKDRYITTDVTKLANAYQMYLTGQHLAVPHKFASTKKEFDEAYGGDSSHVGGFNRGGLEIWYGPEVTARLTEIFNTKKLPTDPKQLKDAIYGLSTIVHEQFHSIRFDTDLHASAQRWDREPTRWWEEGLTQYLTLQSTENFLKFSGLLDDENNKKLFDSYKGNIFKDSVYQFETGTVGVISWVVSQKLGLNEQQVVTGLLNMKGQAVISTSGMAKALSKILGEDKDKITTALREFANRAEAQKLTMGAFKDLVIGLGGSEKMAETVAQAIRDAGGSLMGGYDILREQMK